MFSLLEATIKHLSASFEVPLLIWGRYFAHLILIPLFFPRQLSFRALHSKRPGVQVLRASCLVGATASNFLALRYLELYQTTSIFFISPLLVTAVSIMFLKDRVELRRWVMIVCGFSGVLVIVRPGTGEFHWAMLLVLVTSCMFTTYQITTRMLANTDSDFTTLCYTALIGVIILSPVVPFFWTTPDWQEWLLIGFAGFMAGTGHWLFILAHQHATASTLAPYLYTQIIWASLFSWLLFEAFPDALTLLGAGIIIVCGLVLWSWEQNRRIGVR